MLEVTDVWSSNAEEAEDVLRAIGDEPPKDLADHTTAVAPQLRGDAVAIVRDGPEGCAVRVPGATTTYVPGFPQTPVDTNGAGDTHTGALLAEVAAGTPWVEGCRRANAAAAIKVTRRGPESPPTAAEVDTFLARLDERRA
jgi:sugar/nucleoside kinase (ribokinase family)